MRKILVIGKNSFIGSNFHKQSVFSDVIKHDEVNDINFKNYDTILNCSISPEYKKNPYQEKNDMDFFIAQKAQKNDCHYIMLSSRKVYGKSLDLKTYYEDSPIIPFDYYSENKYITENKIRTEIKKHTIIRASNVFGDEYGRDSFLGFCLTQLKNYDKIIFNINGDIKRDFIYIDDFVKALNSICLHKKIGTFNLSSNHALTISQIPKLLIEGKKSGTFSSSGSIDDQFVLNNDLIQKSFDIKIRKNFENELKMIGKKYARLSD